VLIEPILPRDEANSTDACSAQAEQIVFCASFGGNHGDLDAAPAGVVGLVRTRPEYAPGATAPAAGVYELLNIFGTPVGVRVPLANGETLPGASIGWKWRLVISATRSCAPM
jgi:hypothetical protein